MTADPVVPGRSCGECSLCCKVMRVNALEKPPDVWCRHCRPGKGCGIYADRPQDCRDFICLYLRSAMLDEQWKPNVCRMVLHLTEDQVLVVGVDATRPDAWRREPYYSWLREKARIFAARRWGRVEISVAGRRIIVFPDRDVDLGPFGDDDVIIAGERRTSHGIELTAIKLHKDDPRLKNRTGEAPAATDPVTRSPVPARPKE